MRVRRLWAERRTELRTLRRRSHEVVLLAAVVGITTGLLVAGFDRLVVEVVQARVLELPLPLLAGAPLVGLVIASVVLRTIGRGASSSTADEYLHAFHDPAYVLTERGLVARVLGAVATVGFGGPMGLEGPSICMGATVGQIFQRRLPRVFGTEDRRALMVAGAAAAVAAIFKTPLTGVVFALEVPYRDDLARRMLLPALVASASGYLVFIAINGTSPLFHVAGEARFSFADLGGAVAVGLICGVLARLFAVMLRRAKTLAGRRSWWATVGAGAALAGAFVALRGATGQDLAFTSGYNVVAWAVDGNHALWVIAVVGLVRVCGTAVTVAGGGVGGQFIPLVVGGTVVGRFCGEIIPGADRTLLVVVGAAAFLGGGYRVPLAAVAFVAEATGRPGFIVPGLLAAVAAELMMGPSSITAYQVDPSLTA